MAKHQAQQSSPEFKQLVRIGQTDIPGHKRVAYGLTAIKGVSYMIANAICFIAGVDKMKKIGELSDQEINNIEQAISKLSEKAPKWLLNRRKDYSTGKDLHLIKTDLDLTRDFDLRRLKKIKSYRGLRLQWGLPVRGQRTKSNFRKNKGKALGVRRKKK
ncbi:30S ribosomal protein S13 [Candidatus Woesearchaeota archaeon]|nr:30S ribosomal protein S13 [Candidatus Woesearchaeota archaeon]